MNSKILEQRMEDLNERLRILILQNARESTFYDEGFLREIRDLADQMLCMKDVYGGRKNGIALPLHNALVQF